MKTINKILEYNLTEIEIFKLQESWIINWCGWKWWQDFDKILKDNIEFLPWFNKWKSEKLYSDIRAICFEHDIDFRFKKWFYKSNFKMAKKLFLLLAWAKISHRISISIITFYFLSRYWKNFYYTKRK